MLVRIVGIQLEDILPEDIADRHGLHRIRLGLVQRLSHRRMLSRLDRQQILFEHAGRSIGTSYVQKLGDSQQQLVRLATTNVPPVVSFALRITFGVETEEIDPRRRFDEDVLGRLAFVLRGIARRRRREMHRPLFLLPEEDRSIVPDDVRVQLHFVARRPDLRRVQRQRVLPEENIELLQRLLLLELHHGHVIEGRGRLKRRRRWTKFENERFALGRWQRSEFQMRRANESGQLIEVLLAAVVTDEVANVGDVVIVGDGLNARRKRKLPSFFFSRARKRTGIVFFDVELAGVRRASRTALNRCER